MSNRLFGLLVKEFIQLFRDPVMLSVVLYFYTICILICAYALTFEVEKLRLAVVDLDRSPASRALVDQMGSANAFTPIAGIDSVDEAISELQSDGATVALVIPQNFESKLASQDSTTLQVLVDGANSNVAAQARANILEIVSMFEGSLSADTAGNPVIEPVIRILYNTDLSYSSFIVISMIAIAALIVGVIHPAASLVREKESGTIEQLRMTPIGIVELFIGKTVPTLTMGLLSLFPSLAIVSWFGIAFQGGIATLMIVTTIFLLSAISIGVLIAAVARTLQQALLLSFFGLFPLMFLSGTIVPIESMPEALQAVSVLSPLRHYLEALLGLAFKGSDLGQLWVPLMALILVGVPLFSSAAWIFRRSWL